MKIPASLWYLEGEVARARQAYMEAADKRAINAPTLANAYLRKLHEFRRKMREYKATLGDNRG